MDIRNITEEPPKVEEGKYLEKMFDLQKELTEGYIKIEGLPQYPININAKKSQVILKDFASRVTEELAEGYESTHLAVQMVSQVGWNIDKLNSQQYQMLVNHLQNSNEEQADATAFFIELLLYAGVTPQHLREFALDQVRHNPDAYMVCSKYPTLQLLMEVGALLLNNFHEVPEYPFGPQGYRLIDEYTLGKDEYLKVKEYCPAFNQMSGEFHKIEAALLWQIQYHLGVGRNYLKNKPWKQTGELSDEEPYYENLCMGIIKMFGYHHIVGFTPDSLYRLFFKKNRVNVFRQKSEY